jgi:hypothetical protein
MAFAQMRAIYSAARPLIKGDSNVFDTTIGATWIEYRGWNAEFRMPIERQVRSNRKPGFNEGRHV